MGSNSFRTGYSCSPNVTHTRNLIILISFSLAYTANLRIQCSNTKHKSNSTQFSLNAHQLSVRMSSLLCLKIRSLLMLWNIQGSISEGLFTLEIVNPESLEISGKPNPYVCFCIQSTKESGFFPLFDSTYFILHSTCIHNSGKISFLLPMKIQQWGNTMLKNGAECTDMGNFLGTLWKYLLNINNYAVDQVGFPCRLHFPALPGHRNWVKDWYLDSWRKDCD